MNTTMNKCAKFFTGAISVLSAVAAFEASAAGFGIYEMSAKAVGVGGHVVARPVDASANYYNPAGLSSLTGTVITAGAMMLAPRLDTEVNSVGSGKMDSGYFFLPHGFISQQLPAGFTFGLGMYADFGIGSRYNNDWALKHNSIESRLEGITINPNLSYKITDKWSFAAGLRLTQVRFKQRRIIPLNHPMLGYLGDMNLELRARNDIDVGYVLGTQYDLFDNFSIGAVYRTRVRARLDGDSRAAGFPAVAWNYWGDLSEKLDLPSSATVGFAWDVIEDLHLGASLTWTEWSTIDQINFGHPALPSLNLGWHNAYRTGFGFAYDITDDFSWLMGYVYDWDPSEEKRAGTMLPPGDRHIVSFGFSYRFLENWDISASYAIIIMPSKTVNVDGVNFGTDNSYTHCAGVTLTYAF